MPNTEAVEAMVKAYSETPAKVQDKEITIKMMMQPVDLNYTVSVLFISVKLCIEKNIYKCPRTFYVCFGT